MLNMKEEAGPTSSASRPIRSAILAAEPLIVCVSLEVVIPTAWKTRLCHRDCVSQENPFSRLLAAGNTRWLYQSDRELKSGGRSPLTCHRQKSHWARAPRQQSSGSRARIAPPYWVLPVMIVL